MASRGVPAHRVPLPAEHLADLGCWRPGWPACQSRSPPWTAQFTTAPDERKLSAFTAGSRKLHSLFTAFVNTSLLRVKRGKEGQPVRVLLIEDDVSLAQSIELMLKSETFTVYTTALGEVGVDLGKLYDYNIILLDLNLPDMSGYEVLRSLRVAKVKTPILILSGLAGRICCKVRLLGSASKSRTLQQILPYSILGRPPPMA